MPLADQATALAGQGDFHQALAFASLLPEEEEEEEEKERVEVEQRDGGEGAAAAPSLMPPLGVAEEVSELLPKPLRLALEQRLRLLYGHHLFSAGHHDEGMAQMAMCSGTGTGSGSGISSGPLLLLRLFPSLVSEQDRRYLPRYERGLLLPEVEEPKGPARPSAVGSHYFHTCSTEYTLFEVISMAPALFSQMAACLPICRTWPATYWIHTVHTIVTCPHLMQVTALMPYLMSHRSRVLSGAEGVGESVDNGPATGSVDGGAAGARLSRQELLRIIDTAIVKVHMPSLRMV